MNYEGQICRPPMERASFMLPVEVGCSYNRCRFCTLFKHLKFRELPMSDVEAELQRVKNLGGHPKRIFLGDGNPFGLSTEHLLDILKLIHSYFPDCREINMDATVTNISEKSDEELRRLHEEGIQELYLGIESGMDELLRYMKKDHTVEEAYEQIARLKQAGLIYNAHLMLGLAGAGRGLENAERTAEKLKAASGWREHPPAFFKTFEPGYLAFAGITARHISIWRENRIFCGRCGSENIPSETERAAVCPSCGLTVYPEIMPAVIVAVYDGDRLLMVRSEKASYKHFALVAGYTEIGETFEQTVRREVMEETGLRIKNIRYFGNQPWGFSNSQMVGFFAELDGSPEITLQESELTEARWFDRRDIPLPPYKTSIGNRMISLFRENAVPE